MDSITNSSMSCFKSCRQKFYWSYELRWRPAQEKHFLRIGSMVHEGLDLMAKGVDLEKIIDVIVNLYAEKIIDLTQQFQNDELEYKLSIECATVQALVSGYFEAWKDSKVEILESEQIFDLPIYNENGNEMRLFRQQGKRDRLGKLPDGRIALIETKTCSEDIAPGSEYRNVLAINQQISMYYNAALMEGKKIETTLYDCIRKPTIKPSDVPLVDKDGIKIVLGTDGKRVMKANGEPRKSADTAKGYVLQTCPMKPVEWLKKLTEDIAERPEFYYQRFEVPRLQSDIDGFKDELWMIAKDIGDCRRLGRWYRNTSNCRMFNSLCSYYPLCAGERDLSNGVPEGFRQAETVHEELVKK